MRSEKFIPNKDTALFKTWHSSSWEDKLRLLDKFQDKRCSWFGQKIIYQEAPQILPPDLYKNIKSEISDEKFENPQNVAVQQCWCLVVHSGLGRGDAIG